jgi:hypothetical protein
MVNASLNSRFDQCLALFMMLQLQPCSNLLFKQALAIHRQKPELNHGTKASRELSVFF